MTVHDVTLGVPQPAIGWLWSPPSGNRRLPAALVVGGVEAHVRLVQITNFGRLNVFLSSTDSSTGLSTGPELTEALERNLAGWQFIQGGVVRGTAAGATPDTSEPYTLEGLTSLYNAVNARSTQSWTLRLDDGIVPSQTRDATLPATALGAIAAPSLSPQRVARPPATRDAQLPATSLGGIAAPALSPVRVARDARTVDVTLPATALGALAAPALSPQRVARPPETRDATLALRATDTTFRSLTVTWNVDHEPDFVRFDIRLDDGSWIRTTDTSHVFDDLEPGTEHTVTLRSVRESGNVEQSIMAYTAAAAEPSVVRLPRIRSNGDTTARVDVVEPESDGGHDITHYEYAVDGGDYESTNGPETTWTIRGLALGRKYAIMIRARTAFAPGDSVVLKHDTRQRAAGVRTPVHRQRIPLPNDDDRLSAIIRIGDRECLLRLWWQPYDSAWYATFESPVGTPLVSGRRIAAGAPVLGPGPGRRTMGGDIWCRRLAGSGEPHERPWGITHVLVWEATR